MPSACLWEGRSKLLWGCNHGQEKVKEKNNGNLVRLWMRGKDSSLQTGERLYDALPVLWGGDVLPRSDTFNKT